MKRLLTAAAMIAAVSTSVVAQDNNKPEITISGNFDYFIKDMDNTTTSNVDAEFSINPSFMTDTGFHVAADINIDQDGNDAGDTSLTLSKGIWSLDVGDTSSALDAIDDVADFTSQLGDFTPSTNHDARLTLRPSDALTVHLSAKAEDTAGMIVPFGTGGSAATSSAGAAAAMTYDIGQTSVGAGYTLNDDNSKEMLVNAAVNVDKFNVGAEYHRATNVRDTNTDTMSVGATFQASKNTLIGAEYMTANLASNKSDEAIVYGIQHKISTGVKAFAEYEDNLHNTRSNSLVIGLGLEF